MIIRICIALSMLTSASALGASLEEAPSAVSIRAQVGEPLRRALDRYTTLGLNVVSTTRTLPRRLLVKTLPDATTDIDTQVRTLLKPHGLTLVMVDANNGFVERLRVQKTIEQPVIDEPQETQPLIEEMVVTSHYRVRRNGRVNQHIDQQSLQSTPSLGRDALRSLKALPGIASSGVSARHQFRGGDTNEVLYRLDGIELLEPFHLPNVQDLFSSININIIEAADVYVAGFPVSLGSRMSGVVDLELIEPPESLGGSVDVNFIAASTEAHGWLGDWSWLASARQSLVHKALEQFETDYGTPRFEDEFIHLTHATSEHEFVAGILNSRDRVRVQDSGESGQSRNEYLAGWLRWTQYHTPTLASTWQLSHISIENRRRGEVDKPSSSTGNLSESREFTTMEISNHWNWHALDNLDIDTGWSIASQDGEFEASLDAVYGPVGLPIQPTPQVQRNTNIDRSGESIQAYLSATIELIDDLTLEAGVRYDGQDIDPVHVNEVSARFNLAYQVSPKWMLAADVGRYTQQQHLYEIQIDDGKAELDTPQNSDQINLTSIWSPTPSTRFRLDLYHRQINSAWSHFENLYNRWVLLPELAGDRFEITPSRVRANGVELTFGYQPSDAVSLNLQYAYSKAREKYLGKLRNRPWDQKRSYKASISWKSERWQTSLSTTYRTGWPTTQFIATQADLSRLAYQDRLPSYFTVDAHVSRSFAVPRGSVELYLDVINLSDRENVGGYDFNTAGNPDAQGLLPIMPTLGVLWRW